MKLNTVTVEDKLFALKLRELSNICAQNMKYFLHMNPDVQEFKRWQARLQRIVDFIDNLE